MGTHVSVSMEINLILSSAHFKATKMFQLMKNCINDIKTHILSVKKNNVSVSHNKKI